MKRGISEGDVIPFRRPQPGLARAKADALLKLINEAFDREEDLEIAIHDALSLAESTRAGELVEALEDAIIALSRVDAVLGGVDSLVKMKAGIVDSTG